jgi:hypothetical protein
VQLKHLLVTVMSLRQIGVGALAGAATLLAGCGGSTTTVAVTAPAGTSKTSTVVVHDQVGRPAQRRQWRSCDANIRAKIGTTSCAFAENVFYGYWRAAQAGDDAFQAYSPMTGRDYPMTCTSGTEVICRAGDGAAVRFARAAAEAYTSEAAAAYCSSHQVTAADLPCDTAAAPPAPADQPAPSTSGGAGAGCDPNYTGACLDPNSPDYDCAGGSGDGPDYTGTVTVVGNDHFGLDRDGNGIGCE